MISRLWKPAISGLFIVLSFLAYLDAGTGSSRSEANLATEPVSTLRKAAAIAAVSRYSLNFVTLPSYRVYRCTQSYSTVWLVDRIHPRACPNRTTRSPWATNSCGWNCCNSRNLPTVWKTWATCLRRGTYLQAEYVLALQLHTTPHLLRWNGLTALYVKEFHV